MSDLNLKRALNSFILPLLAGVLLTACSVTGKYARESVAKWSKDIQQFQQLDKNVADPENAILLLVHLRYKKFCPYLSYPIL